MNTPFLQQQIVSRLQDLNVFELSEVLNFVEALWQQNQTFSYQPESIHPATLVMIDQAIKNAQLGILGNSFNPDQFCTLLTEGDEE
jgi:hypothetical protein